MHAYSCVPRRVWSGVPCVRAWIAVPCHAVRARVYEVLVDGIAANGALCDGIANGARTLGMDASAAHWAVDGTVYTVCHGLRRQEFRTCSGPSTIRMGYHGRVDRLIAS